jgi:phosphate starvation-inducible PhoH-like protein
VRNKATAKPSPKRSVPKKSPTPAERPPVKIQTRNRTQREYLEAIQANDLTFGIGPAGTGKTFLAVAAAVEAYQKRQIKRIVLVRPALEAGERLGFLPGTLKEKIDPYLRPLYDSLDELLPADKIKDMLDSNAIEIAPLAFMRGRTLKDAFVILDEAQNTTRAQMLMLITRLGENSKLVINGDTGQIDLPKPELSGLIEALHVLEGMEGVGVSRFTEGEVVRHRLVQRVVKAYEGYKRGARVN